MNSGHMFLTIGGVILLSEDVTVRLVVSGVLILGGVAGAIAAGRIRTIEAEQ